jgi:hypothetical protein
MAEESPHVPGGLRTRGRRLWEAVTTVYVVNGSRNLTPWRQVKIDPLVGHWSSLAALVGRPRSRSLSR